MKQTATATGQILYPWEPDELTATVAIRYAVRFGRPAKTYGPPERCYEAEPTEVDITDVDIVSAAYFRNDQGHELKTEHFAVLAEEFRQRLAGGDAFCEDIENRCIEDAVDHQYDEMDDDWGDD